MLCDTLDVRKPAGAVTETPQVEHLINGAAGGVIAVHGSGAIAAWSRKMEYTRLIIGFLIILAAGRVIVGEQITGASANAVVTAPLNTVRAPAAGRLDLPGRALSAAIEDGEEIATVTDARADRVRLDDLHMERGFARAERQIEDTVAVMRLLDERTGQFTSARIDELETRLGHAHPARAARARARRRRGARGGPASRLRGPSGDLATAADEVAIEIEGLRAVGEEQLRLGEIDVKAEHAQRVALGIADGAGEVDEADRPLLGAAEQVAEQECAVHVAGKSPIEATLKPRPRGDVGAGQHAAGRCDDRAIGSGEPRPGDPVPATDRRIEHRAQARRLGTGELRPDMVERAPVGIQGPRELHRRRAGAHLDRAFERVGLIGLRPILHEPDGERGEPGDPDGDEAVEGALDV